MRSWPKWAGHVDKLEGERLTGADMRLDWRVYRSKEKRKTETEMGARTAGREIWQECEES